LCGKNTIRFFKDQTIMSNNQVKSNGLKVVFKKNNDSLVPQNISESEFGEQKYGSDGFKEVYDRILNDYNRIKIEIYHFFERRTFGLFSKMGGVILVKVCIIAIIMLFILKEDIADNFKKPNFASVNTIEGKTNTNKPKKSVATPASLGSVVDDFAPAALEELREVQVRQYIEHFSQTAVGEMDKFGIPASISMAQAIIESRSGTSTLAVRNNNHFGVKCFSKTCPEGHCSNFTDDHHKDFFRKYPGPWESWREHSQFLMKNSYRTLLKHGKNYRAWALGLREIGYATDPAYDKKLISVIERYDLEKLDDL
jgi:flagellum-specific peptidoglycan hydrolase FlgJ